MSGWKSRRCDRCNVVLEGRGQYKFSYGGMDYWVCGRCMQEIIKKELLVSKELKE